jgi:hypothetical protein
VHPGVGVAVCVVAFAGHPLVQGPELPKLTRAASYVRPAQGKAYKGRKNSRGHG